jgi:hypothetical protein
VRLEARWDWLHLLLLLLLAVCIAKPAAALAASCKCMLKVVVHGLCSGEVQSTPARLL